MPELPLLGTRPGGFKYEDFHGLASMISRSRTRIQVQPEEAQLLYPLPVYLLLQARRLFAKSVKQT